MRVGPVSDPEIAQLADEADDPGLNAGLVARWTRQSLDGDQWPGTGPTPIVAQYRSDTKIVCPHDDGYRGIWYSNQAQGDEYVYKYSGGLGTYCAKHRPFAVYAPEVKKMFFCYGGSPKGKNTLVHMVSYYDHKTGMVPCTAATTAFSLRLGSLASYCGDLAFSQGCGLVFVACPRIPGRVASPPDRGQDVQSEIRMGLRNALASTSHRVTTRSPHKSVPSSPSARHLGTPHRED